MFSQICYYDKHDIKKIFIQGTLRTYWGHISSEQLNYCWAIEQSHFFISVDIMGHKSKSRFHPSNIIADREWQLWTDKDMALF